MLTQKELEKFKSLLGFTIWQVERDYLQHLILLILSRKTSQEFIFKGGTALQKTFGLNRFSIDLDFTKNGEFADDIFEQLRKEVTNFGFEAEITVKEQKESQLVKIAMKGPLYKGMERSLTILRLEISLREQVLLPASTKEIYPLYPDIPPYLISVMDLEEILAEKVRAILTRDKARDVFDLRFLLKKGVKINKKLVEEKLQKYNIPFSTSLLVKKIEMTKPFWEQELGALLFPVPQFHDVRKEIIELLN